MLDRSQPVTVEGRVRFQRSEAAQQVAERLRSGRTGTVFDHEQPDTRITVTGRSLRLFWQGLAAVDDHEHTYLWLTQAIDGADKGAFIVSGDGVDTVFCLVEEHATDHLSEVIGAIWAESSETEALRDDFDCARLPQLIQVWRDLDTWAAKSYAVMFLLDCVRAQRVPPELETLLYELWSTPEPADRGPEADRGEIECSWTTQAMSVDRVIPDDSGDTYHQIANVLSGEARQARFVEGVRQARRQLNAGRQH